MTTDANGLIYVAAVDQNADPASVVVRRYTDKGAPDTTWGVSGVFTHALAEPAENVAGIAVDSDGEVFVAATAGTSTWVVKLDSAGALDTGFSGGAVDTAIPCAPAHSMAVDSDGDIWVVNLESGEGDCTGSEYRKLDGTTGASLLATDADWLPGFALDIEAVPGGGVALLAIFGDTGNDELRGGKGNDSLNAGEGVDKLWGDDGTDTLDGGNDVDELRGGAGNDIINGVSGDDLMWGDTGNDTLNGGLGADLINGGTGADKVDGGTGADTLSGGDDADKLMGDNGNDILNGGNGLDGLWGGGGADDLNGNAGADALDGGAGKDSCNGGAGQDSGTACETRTSVS